MTPSYPIDPAPAIDPVKLDRLAEVAVKVGLQLQAGQDLLLTAPVDALAAGAADRRACLSAPARVW